MSIRFSCPSCQASYQVADDMAGRQARCKKCGRTMLVPAMPPPAETDPFGPSYMPDTPAPLPIGPPMPAYRPPPAYGPPAGLPAYGAPPPFGAYPGRPRPRGAMRGLIVAIGIAAGLAVLGAVAGYIYWGTGPSEAQIRAKLPGSWSVEGRDSSGPLAGDVVFNADNSLTGTLRQGGRNLRLAGTWSVSGRRLSINGLLVGHVRKLDDSTMEVFTQHGTETYRRKDAPAPIASPGTLSRPRQPTPPPQPPADPRTQKPAPAVTLGPTWIDLLALQRSRQPLAAGWALEGTVLAGNGAASSGPLRLASLSQTGFEMEMTFNRTNGQKEFCIIFPAGQRSAELWLGGMAGQSSSISDNPKAKTEAPRLVNGRAQRLVLKVVPRGSDVSISVLLDGSPYLSFEGPQSEMRVDDDHAVPAQTLALWLHPMTTVSITALRIRAAQ